MISQNQMNNHMGKIYPMDIEVEKVTDNHYIKRSETPRRRLGHVLLTGGII